MTKAKAISKMLLLFGVLGILIFGFYPLEAHAFTAAVCQKGNNGVYACSIDQADPLLFKPFNAGIAGWNSYYSDSSSYKNGVGDYSLLYLNSWGTGELLQLYSNGSTSNVKSKGPATVAVGNPNALPPSPSASVTGPSTTVTPSGHPATAGGGPSASGSSSASWGQFKDIFGTTCSDYQCWFNDVWNWAMIVVVPLSILMLSWAGFIWMTSAGNPDRIGIAKKIIYGVISGVLLLVLARFFIVNVIGLPTSFWNV